MTQYYIDGPRILRVQVTEHGFIRRHLTLWEMVRLFFGGDP